MRIRLLALLASAVLALVPTPTPVRRAGASEPVRYRLVDAFPGVTFDQPVFAAQPPDGTPRMFVAEQGGRVWIVDHPAPKDAPPAKRLFLDLSEAVNRNGLEEGLHGFAFHPGYAANGRFLAYFTAKYAAAADHRDVVAEFLVRAGDPDLADPATRREILVFRPPYVTHHGGWMAFGPDGMLHLARGDGGPGKDPFGHGQDLGTLFGKILRIDVDRADPGLAYAIPPDNPFVGRAGARGEIWAYGFRNPWRGSFDRETGALFVGDVGQAAAEEIDRVVRGGNYGWGRKEGFADFHPSPVPPADPFVDPLVVYGHDEGQAVVGGYVFRGTSMPSLAGSFVYGDYLTGRIWALDDPSGTPAPRLLLDTDEIVSSFAEDRAGDLYALSFRGRVLALRDDAGPTPEAPLPPTLSGLALFSDLRRARPAKDAVRYEVLSPLWSDGARKDRFLVLPKGTSLGWDDEDAFSLPVGGLAVKTFTLGRRRLETRVILRTAARFEAATYRWREDLSDADRLDAPLVETVGGRAASATWAYPGPDGCRTCHTEEAGFLLGVRAPQVARARVAKWVRAGTLTGAPEADAVPRLTAIDGGGPIDARARSYLDSNCSSCHRPDGPVHAGLDLRATTPLASTGMLDAVPQHGDLGLADARILAPGHPERSVLVARLLATGEDRMPQIGSRVADRAAVRTIERWIRRLKP